MNEQDDIALLHQWTEARSEAAFRTLAERYAPLVWGAALRKTGDRSLAEEAAQQVFSDLARRAPVLVALERPLAPWLHRATVFEAVQVLRREIRHRDRMKQFAETAAAGEPAPDPWEDVRPHLDDALNALNEADRRVVLLHWFERQTFAEAAEKLGCTPAAAQRRSLRALEKLAVSLRRRGTVVPSVTALAAGLTAVLTPPVPAAVTSLICSAAVSGAAAAEMSGSVSVLQKSLHLMASAKLTTAAVVLLSAALPVTFRLADFAWLKPKPAPAAASSANLKVPATGNTVAAAPANALDLNLVRQALARLLADPEDYVTQLDLRRLMFSLNAEEISVVQKLLMAVPGKKKEALYEVSRALFARWAELDPPAAAEAAFAVPKSAFGYYPLRGAFITWAATDLDTAWSWLEKTTTNTMDRNFLGGEALATNVAYQKNGAAMMTRVDAMTDEAWRKEMRYWVLRAWAQHDSPDTVMNWALKLPENEEREERIAETVEQIGASEPDLGLGYIHHIANPGRRLEVGHNILWPYLLSRHPRVGGAGDFVRIMASLTEGSPPELFRDAGEALTMHGARWAMEKLGELPEGKARDEFIQGMLRRSNETDAAALLPALEMLNEESLIRHGGLSGFSQALTRQNPEAAARWITSLPETSAVRQWAGSHFQSITGRSAVDYLNPVTK